MYKPNPLKLGHLVLKVSDLERSIRFYRDVVGLDVSDLVGERMAFMHAGADHHDLALVQMTVEEIAQSATDLHRIEHFAWQLADFDEIEAAIAMLQQRDVEIVRGPGRHGCGENYFVVFRDPDGNQLEFYSDMRQITCADNPYQASTWVDDINTFDQWRCEKFVVDLPPALQARLDQESS